MNTMTNPAIRSWLGRVLLMGLMLQPAAYAAAEQSVKLVGAGASFPAPLYLRWFRDYYRLHPNVKIDYQSIGSGGGIKDLINGRIDFAGSELRLTDKQKAAVEGGVRQVPMTAGAIAVIYNLDGVDDLRLPRDVLVGILTGRIERWNDAALVAANPGVELPDTPITVIARSDASGTSYHFTRHLSAASTEFAEAIGTSMTPNWPEGLKQRGALVRGRGNDGVAAFVRAIPASIGYVQYAYGYLAGMQMATLQNRAGDLVAPGQASFEAALQAIRDTDDPDSIADPPGSDSYPVIAVSWLVVRDEYADPAKRQALLDFIEYALGPGQDVSEKLGYIRFSKQAADYVRGLLDAADQHNAE
jgi:phosphate transport system substrate-binding protein